MNANLYRNAGILPAFVIYGPGFNDSATHAGWVAGAGIEGMISPNWTARLEYLHYEFDTANYFQSGARRILGGLDYDGKSDVVRVGLNYKFGWAGRPL
jgi:outer membrane immunogenic protein